MSSVWLESVKMYIKNIYLALSIFYYMFYHNLCYLVFNLEKYMIHFHWTPGRVNQVHHGIKLLNMSIPCQFYHWFSLPLRFTNSFHRDGRVILKNMVLDAGCFGIRVCARMEQHIYPRTVVSVN